MNPKKAINQVSLRAPAKVNLFLAATGKRADGFHEINSVMSTIQFSDQVTLSKTRKNEEVLCVCKDDPTLSGPNNLACRAILEWRKFTGDRTGVKVSIIKRIPKMAGLGGGSSDAVATLRALNLLHGQPLRHSELLEIAEKLGSDCPFFLGNGLAQVKGKGEKVIQISGNKKEELNGRRIFFFQPPFGFRTPLLYQLLAKESLYSNSEWAEESFQKWKNGAIPVCKFLYNDFENIILRKYLFLDPLFKELEKRFGLKFHVSGSGSSCFSFAPENLSSKQVKDLVKKLLGENSHFWVSRISFN